MAMPPGSDPAGDHGAENTSKLPACSGMTAPHSVWLDNADTQVDPSNVCGEQNSTSPLANEVTRTKSLATLGSEQQAHSLLGTKTSDPAFVAPSPLTQGAPYLSTSLANRADITSSFQDSPISPPENDAGTSPNVRDSFDAPDTTPSAVSRVFGLVELSEKILLFLPFKDILLAQRVARQWRATITTSLPLQQALFLKPRPALYAWLHDRSHCNEDDPGERNEPDEDWDGEGLGGDHGTKTTPEYGFICKVAIDYKLSPKQISSGQFSIKKSGYLHPLFVNESACTFYAAAPTWPALGRLRRKNSAGGCIPSRTHPEASWRKMLWCQPPVEKCGIYLFTRGWIPGIVKEVWYETYVSIEDGIIMYSSRFDLLVKETKYPRPGGVTGPVTIGEVVNMMEMAAQDCEVDVNESGGRVYTKEMFFPGGEEVAKGVVWMEDDDWYYRPLHEKGVLFDTSQDGEDNWRLEEMHLSDVVD